MLATSAGLDSGEKQRKSRGPGSGVAMMRSLYVRQLIQTQLTKLGWSLLRLAQAPAGRGKAEIPDVFGRGPGLGVAASDKQGKPASN